MATTSKVASPKQGKKSLKKHRIAKKVNHSPKKSNSPKKNVNGISHKVDDRKQRRVNSELATVKVLTTEILQHGGSQRKPRAVGR